jgi:hypothetical protein
MRTTWPSSVCIVALALASLTACNPAERARQAKDDVDSGNAAACVEERSAIEKAVQSYTLLEPDAPISEAAMVTAGYIHSESILMEVQPDGTVVAAPGSVCA